MEEDETDKRQYISKFGNSAFGLETYRCQNDHTIYHFISTVELYTSPHSEIHPSTYSTTVQSIHL